MMYYWACAFKKINSLNITFNILPTWLAIEVEDCDPYLPAALVLSPMPLDKAKDVQNPIHNSFRIWKQIKSHFTHKTLPLSLPIAKNPSNLDSTFSYWRKLGLSYIHDLYTEGKFASFAQLQTKFKLHSNNFFRYLQVRDYFRKFMLDFETQPQSILDECFTIPPYKDKFISNIYNKLQTMSSPSSNKYKESWEKDMGIHIPDDIWEKSLKYIPNTFQILYQTLINVSPPMQHFFMLFFLALKLPVFGLMYLMYCQEFLRIHCHRNHC